MEKSNLEKLKREVLDLGPEAALPLHLSDIWLDLLWRDIDLVLKGQSDDHAYLVAPLALIAHILIGKQGNDGPNVSFTSEDLWRYLQELRMEISVEMLRRQANLDVKPPATLKTIFEDQISSNPG